LISTGFMPHRGIIQRRLVKAPHTLTAAYIAKRWKRLYHMAEGGSWPSIAQHGLLSTTALLDLFEITGAEREPIEATRRPDSVKLTHPDHGEAWIRDNKPINETVLRRTLLGMSEAEWYRTLNGRVFFWLNKDRLNKLRKAGAYSDREHDILTIDTGRLLEAHGQEVELAHLNTGAVHAGAKYLRGLGTFRTIAEYHWVERLRVARNEPIVELTVPYSVPDIAKLVVDVDRR
jgi:hypothetical protein